MRKKAVLSAIFFMMAMLAACTKYQINEEQSDNNNPFPDYVYNQEKEQGGIWAVRYGNSRKWLLLYN